MKPVAGGSSPRLRIEVTDLNNRARAMIGTQMYTMASAEVRPGRILKLREYVVNIVSNKRYKHFPGVNCCVLSFILMMHGLCLMYFVITTEQVLDKKNTIFVLSFVIRIVTVSCPMP